jgi:hypothetical protein
LTGNDISLELAAFILSFASLCVTLVIVSEQRIVKRKLEEKEKQEIKSSIAYMMTDIQTVNQSLSASATALGTSSVPVPSLRLIMDDQVKRLEKTIQDLNLKLHLLHDEYSRSVKEYVQLMKSDSVFMSTALKVNDYVMIVSCIKTIERRCRPYTDTEYGFADVENSKNTLRGERK